MEILDVYNEEGKPVGKTVPRGTPRSEFNEGEHIAIVQIFIENEEGKFLFEKSAKVTGYKYLPIGGHIVSGETPDEGILREAYEEVGLDLNKENVQKLGFFLLDFPVRYIYYLKKNIDFSKLKLQEEKVEDLIYLTVDEVDDYIDNGLINPVNSKLIKRVLEYTKK